MVDVALRNVVQDPNLVARIAEAVDSAQQHLADFSAKEKLDQLSPDTVVDHIDLMHDGIFKEGSQFAGICTFYVELNAGQGDEAISLPEAFPGKVEGHIDANDNVVIDEMTVDTSSFFE